MLITIICYDYHWVKTLINLNMDRGLWFRKINNGIIVGVVIY